MMLKIFRQPYAVLDPPPVQLRIAGLIGLFVAGFLLVFQPFGIGVWQTEHKWLIISGFGLVTFLVTTFHYIFWPTLFPHFFSEKQWTVGRAIGYMILNILLIAVGNHLYLGWLLNRTLNPHDLFGMILITLIVGVFPTTGVVIAGYIRRLRAYRDMAATLLPKGPFPASTPNNPKTLTESTQSLLTLLADNEKDTLTLTAVDLLYIESSDNYCTVYHLREGKLQKPLLRSSLSRMETQLVAQPRLVRCHRSFIVNLDQVERVTGNAQGYKLHLFDGQLEVPVARRYNETLVAGLKGA